MTIGKTYGARLRPEIIEGLRRGKQERTLKMRKMMMALLILVIVPVCAFAQNGAEITQFFPQLVAGSLSASDWESRVLLVNLGGEPNAVTVDFFDASGHPLTVSTNKCVASSFIVTLPKPASDSVSSDVLEIFRNSGSFVTGWVKAHSTKPFGADLGFSQFAPGSTEPIGKADVPPSPVENVFTYPLAPSNGVALVNPGSQDANVKFTAFDRNGNKLKEGTFGLARGAHMSTFFNQAPFFLDAVGIIVIASNVPLSGVSLEFDGLVFKTVPRIPTPRRLDSARAEAKIGFVYIRDNGRQTQPGIQARLAEYVGFQQALLDKELPLNGFNRVQLPYDLDVNGLPKVEIIDGGNREQYFDYTKVGFERVRWEVLEKEINAHAPSYWTRRVIFVDMWLDREVGGMLDDIVINGGGAGSWISALYLPFLKKAYFGDKRQYRGVPIQEFGDRPFPYNRGGNETFEDIADQAISVVNHENGHAFWALGHHSSDNPKFHSMMGDGSKRSCMNPAGPVECILLQVEANGIAIGELSRSNDFGWIPF